MSFTLFSSGDNSIVWEEPLPHPIQKLIVDIGFEGQPWGQLHDDYDRHAGSWQKEPWCEDEQPVVIFMHNILLKNKNNTVI